MNAVNLYPRYGGPFNVLMIIVFCYLAPQLYGFGQMLYEDEGLRNAFLKAVVIGQMMTLPFIFIFKYPRYFAAYIRTIIYTYILVIGLLLDSRSQLPCDKLAQHAVRIIDPSQFNSILKQPEQPSVYAAYLSPSLNVMLNPFEQKIAIYLKYHSHCDRAAIIDEIAKNLQSTVCSAYLNEEKIIENEDQHLYSNVHCHVVFTLLGEQTKTRVKNMAEPYPKWLKYTLLMVGYSFGFFYDLWEFIKRTKKQKNLEEKIQEQNKNKKHFFRLWKQPSLIEKKTWSGFVQPLIDPSTQQFYKNPGFNQTENGIRLIEIDPEKPTQKHWRAYQQLALLKEANCAPNDDLCQKLSEIQKMKLIATLWHTEEFMSATQFDPTEIAEEQYTPDSPIIVSEPVLLPNTGWTYNQSDLELFWLTVNANAIRNLWSSAHVCPKTGTNLGGNHPILIPDTVVKIQVNCLLGIVISDTPLI